MKRNSRLSVALHMLIHMDELGGVLASDTLGPMMQTNPVVVRRTMSGLRDAGIVSSEKGHGGGWTLARPLDAITLGDVYDALGAPAFASIGPRVESPGCIVEQAVNGAIGDALEEAEALLHRRFRAISLADLAAEVRRKGWHRHWKKGTKSHA